MAEDRDAPCPKRGPGLTHATNGGMHCLHCGVLTVRVSKAPDPVAELRARAVADLEAALRPSPRQARFWAFLRYCYSRPAAMAERSDVEPIGPADREWLEAALARLDDLDPPEVE